ncbi:MAG: hypothetical protein QW404_03675 [Candidatus Nanoarchaeia archaeon]
MTIKTGGIGTPREVKTRWDDDGKRKRATTFFPPVDNCAKCSWNCKRAGRRSMNPNILRCRKTYKSMVKKSEEVLAAAGRTC